MVVPLGRVRSVGRSRGSIPQRREGAEHGRRDGEEHERRAACTSRGGRSGGTGSRRAAASPRRRRAARASAGQPVEHGCQRQAVAVGGGDRRGRRPGPAGPAWSPSDREGVGERPAAVQLQGRPRRTPAATAAALGPRARRTACVGEQPAWTHSTSSSTASGSAASMSLPAASAPGRPAVAAARAATPAPTSDRRGARPTSGERDRDERRRRRTAAIVGARRTAPSSVAVRSGGDRRSRRPRPRRRRRAARTSATGDAPVVDGDRAALMTPPRSDAVIQPQPSDVQGQRRATRHASPAGVVRASRTDGSVTAKEAGTANGTIVRTRADSRACALAVRRSARSSARATKDVGDALDRLRRGPAEVGACRPAPARPAHRVSTGSAGTAANASPSRAPACDGMDDVGERHVPVASTRRRRR